MFVSTEYNRETLKQMNNEALKKTHMKNQQISKKWNDVTIIIELHPLLFLIIMKSLNPIYDNMDIKFNKTQNKKFINLKGIRVL